MVIMLSGLTGGVTFIIARYFAGKELIILWALLGLWLILFLSVVKFDFMVLIAFCLFGMVRIEPAPVDGLLIILLLVGLLTGKLSLQALNGSAVIHFIVWVFLIANFASLLETKTFFDSLRFLAITVYLISFTYFIKMYITSFQAVRNVMIGYFVSVMGNVLLITLGYMGIPPFTDLFLQEGTRAVGAFKDPNVLGPFCIPIIVWLIDECLHPRILPRFGSAKILIAIVLTAVVFVSFSRAAWANLALALFVYLFLSIKEVCRIRISNLLKWGSSLLLLLVLLAVIGSQMYKPFFNGMDLKEFLGWRISSHEYDAYRFERQMGGIEAGLTHLFGVGPGMWDNAHSLYARTLAEHGFLGFSSLLLLILILLIGLFLRTVQGIEKPYGLSAKVVLGCLVGLVLNSAVIDTIHWRHFWFILALAWVISFSTHSALPGDPGRSLSFMGTS